MARAGKARRWSRGGAAKAALKAPIHLYRAALSPLIGWRCRHVPSCSSYALEAIERNGAWRGFWLALSRMARCHPWGSDGLDPPPDIAEMRVPWWAPWRYGQWTGAHITERFAPSRRDDAA